MKSAARNNASRIAQVLLLFSFGACSTSSTGLEDSPPVPPTYYSSHFTVCPLLGDKELQAITGRGYRDGTRRSTYALGNIIGVTKCVYDTDSPPFRPVTIGIAHAYAEEIFSDLEEARRSLNANKVRGIGTQAIWYMEAGELLVLTGDKIVGVALTGEGHEPDSHVKERARRLAGIIIRKLR